METVTLNVNDVKKELMKSKAMANLSHYCSGNIYYNVKVFGSVYQFPISTVDEVIKIVTGDSSTAYGNETKNYTLSYDLGTTAFHAEMRGSELNRWIGKAFEKGEFVKVG